MSPWCGQICKQTSIYLFGQNLKCDQLYNDILLSESRVGFPELYLPNSLVFETRILLYFGSVEAK